jgi:hypothetical protein
VIGVMGAGYGARPQDMVMARDLGAAVAREGWVLLSGGRDIGIMDAVNQGARAAGGLTIGVLRAGDTRQVSDAVDVAIVTGMGSARNAINVLSSDVVIACGVGGTGTASEIALALQSNKPVILLNDSEDSRRYFSRIGGALLSTADTVEAAIAQARDLLAAAR